MKIWGYCEHCDRWFPCRVEPTAEWACPSCDMEPLLIENRELGVGRNDSADGMQLST